MCCWLLAGLIRLIGPIRPLKRELGDRRSRLTKNGPLRAMSGFTRLANPVAAFRLGSIQSLIGG